MTLRSRVKQLIPQPLTDAIDRRQRLASVSTLGKQIIASQKKGLATDPGIDRAVDAALAWLLAAQQHSQTADGGFARDFSLIRGWAPSYPETTGYIIPTLLECAHDFKRPELLESAKRALDWLVGIQFDDGGFQGGVIGNTPVVPVTFNTGQILIGLAIAQRTVGGYTEPMTLAAQWLCDTMDTDGCWRDNPTPFAEPGEKAYETHVSWGLLEAAITADKASWGDAALRNVNWALGKQQSNGWFESCCLSDTSRPLTHTIGYVLRGVIEAYHYSKDDSLLTASCLTADALVAAQRADGALAGRYTNNWRPAVQWSCLTGNCQIASCLLMLFEHTGEARYLQSAKRLNAFVRRTMLFDPESPQVCGAVAGAYPVAGDYGSFEYLNWAAKFFIDSNRLEARLTAQPG